MEQKPKCRLRAVPGPHPRAAHSSQSESPAQAAEGPPKPPADLSTGIRAAEHGADGPASPSCSALGRTPVTGCGSCPQHNLDLVGDEQDAPKVTCVFSVTQDRGLGERSWQDLGPEKQSNGPNGQTETRGRPEAASEACSPSRYVGGTALT